MLTLFSNEKVVFASKGEEITLTNYRINHQLKIQGHFQYESIFLEDISLVKMIFKSSMLYLYLAGIALLLGLFKAYEDARASYYSADHSDIKIMLFVAAVILAILWLISRSRMIEVCSHSGKCIVLNVSDASHEDAISLLEIIQLTKAQRTLELYRENR